jgi:integrase
MQSNNSKGKASKGSVQTKISNGRIQLVFSYPVVNPEGKIKSKRFYLSTGYDETPLGKQQASILVAKIQRDINYGEFDASLNKYKSAAELAEVNPITEPVETKINLGDLWERYVEFKKPQVSQSTYAVDYRKYRNHIASLPTKNLDEAIASLAPSVNAIGDYLVANLKPNAVKRTLTNINACCEWALKSQLIESNPFQNMAKEIQIPKSSFDENQINPFTKEERDAIIEAFESSKPYGYYAL